MRRVLADERVDFPRAVVFAVGLSAGRAGRSWSKMLRGDRALNAATRSKCWRMSGTRRSQFEIANRPHRHGQKHGESPFRIRRGLSREWHASRGRIWCSPSAEWVRWAVHHDKRTRRFPPNDPGQPGRPPAPPRLRGLAGRDGGAVEHRLAHLPEIIDQTMSALTDDERPAAAG